MSPPANVKQFLKGIVSDWIAAVSGVLSILLTTLSFYVPSQTLRYLFVGATYIGLLWAGYRVWARKVQELDEERAKLRNPILKGQLDELLVRVFAGEQLHGSDRCDMEVLLRTTIHNESECSSTIRSYGLVVKDAAGVHDTDHLSPADQCVIERGDPHQDESGGVIGSEIERPNDLAQETAVTPLVRGVHRVGWLHFKVSDINPRSTETAMYCLNATDSFGHRHEICQGSPSLGVGYFRSPD